MNRNEGYYHDTSDGTAANSSLTLSVSNCPNSSVCGVFNMCNSSGDSYGDSSASTQIYESNYSALSNDTINLNRLPNIYQQQHQRLIFPPPPPAPPPLPHPLTEKLNPFHQSQQCHQNRHSSLVSPCKTDFTILTNYVQNSSIPTDNSFSSISSTQRKQKLNVTNSSLSSKALPSGHSSLMSAIYDAKWNLCSLLLIIFLIFLVIYFLLQRIKDTPQRNYLYYKNENNGFLYGNHCFPIKKNLDGIPMPKKIYLNELTLTDLPSRQIIYTQINIKHDAQILFNISVLPHAKIVFYARQTLEPTPVLHDFQRIINADHLHLGTNNENELRRPIKREIIYQDIKHRTIKFALISHFMLAGRWYLGFLSDYDKIEPIRILATVIPLNSIKHEYDGKLVLKQDSEFNCKYNCFGKGECRNGNCQCHPGYSGKYCEETACPVLCSGNGVFNNGKCVCHEGFKGLECELISNWCSVPDCNSHGHCTVEGVCVCNKGWHGEFCEERTCYPDTQCSSHGICKQGICYCAENRWGNNCEKQITEITTNSACSSPLMFTSSSHLKNETNLKNDFNQKKSNIDNDQKNINCENCKNGICMNNKCVCDVGWTGENCTKRLPNCLPGCEEHGVCRPTRRHNYHNFATDNTTFKNEFKCECFRGWNGENCFVSGCGLNNCNGGNGKCSLDKNGDWKCICKPQFFGTYCEFKKELHCNDGIDNDEDGLTDCEDSECCSQSICSSNPMCTNTSFPTSIVNIFSNSSVNNIDFFDKIQFLFGDNNSHQRYVDKKYIDKKRVSVIRGRVLSSLGGALSGVRVSDERNPYAGFSVTRNENNEQKGTFDLVINGGNIVRLLFVRQPYGAIIRPVYISWNEIINIGDVFIDNEHIKQESTCKTVKKRSEDDLDLNYPKVFEDWRTQSNINLNLSDIQQFSSDLSILNHNSRFIELLLNWGSLSVNISISETNKNLDSNLIYNSNRVASHNSLTYIALLGYNISSTLRLVHVEIFISGRIFKKVLAAKTNLFYLFAWDKRNAYNQMEFGLINAKLKIGYEFFDKCNETNILQQSIVWQTLVIKLAGFLVRDDSPFGALWTLNSHHRFYPQKNILSRGDGSRIYLEEENPLVVTTVFGDQQRRSLCQEKSNDIDNIQCSTKADPLPIKMAQIFLPIAVCASPDGSVYVGDFDLIRKINYNGNSVKTLLKLNTMHIGNQYYLAVNPVTELLFISLPLRRQVLKINSHLNIDSSSSSTTDNYHVFVGNGDVCTPSRLNSNKNNCGDNDLAINAKLMLPKGIVFDSYENLYLIDGRKLRFVNASTSEISTIVFDSLSSNLNCEPKNIKLDSLNLEWPTSLAYDYEENELFILDSTIIYRLNIATKVVKILAGQKSACLNQNFNSIFQPLKSVQFIALDQKSRIIYIAQSDEKKLNQIQSINLNGINNSLKLVVGHSTDCNCEDSFCKCDNVTNQFSSKEALLKKPIGLSVDTFGRLYIVDQGNYKIKRLQKYSAEYDTNKSIYSIISNLHNEVYQFDSTGRHLQTLSLQFFKVLATYDLKASNLHKQKRFYKFTIGNINMEIEEFNQIEKKNLLVIKTDGDLMKINFFKNSSQYFDKIEFVGLKKFGYHLQYSNKSFLKSISVFENYESPVELIKINYNSKINTVDSLVLFNKQNIKLLLPITDTKYNRLISQIKVNHLN